MKKDDAEKKLASKNSGKHRCLTCGTTENMGRRRYCSKECRSEFLRRLEMITGLLRALGTKYATFSFTESMLILDVLTNNSKKGYRFLYERKPTQKPADDLFRMADDLGSIWWAKKKQTGKRYRASQYLLEKAVKDYIPPDLVIPLEIRSPFRVGKHLMCLKLTNEDLNSHKAQQAIKSAYWREALKHHPDRGGNSAAFRKINNAYQELINWLKTPELRVRRGIPGKWFFDGKKWKTPLQTSYTGRSA